MDKSAGLGKIVSVRKKTVLKVYVCRNGGGTTWTTSTIKSDSNGKTAIGYERVK